MDFVGRRRESRAILRQLAEGGNVILTGKYGIGRTCLLRHVARGCPEGWRFIFTDFSRTPDQVCRTILGETLAAAAGNPRARRASYRAVRRQVLQGATRDGHRPIIVLDNISKLTAPKLDLLRWFREEERLQLVAIVETFLGFESVEQLRKVLYPARLVTLRRLTLADTRRFFLRADATFEIGWTPSHVDVLARATAGYPLGMVETVQRAVRAPASRGRR